MCRRAAFWMDEHCDGGRRHASACATRRSCGGSACSPAGWLKSGGEEARGGGPRLLIDAAGPTNGGDPRPALSASFGSMRRRPTSRPCSYTRSITWPFSSSSLITAAGKSSPAARSAASDTGCSRARRSCSRARRCWLSTSVTEPNYQLLRPRRSRVPSAARARATATIPRRASWPGWRARQVVNTRAHGQEASKGRQRRPSCGWSRPGGVKDRSPSRNATLVVTVVCDCPRAENAGAAALRSSLSVRRSLQPRQGRSRVEPRTALPASDAGSCQPRRETSRVRPTPPRRRSGGESRGQARPRSPGPRHPPPPPRTPNALVLRQSLLPPDVPRPNCRDRPSVSTWARFAIRRRCASRRRESGIEERGNSAQPIRSALQQPHQSHTWRPPAPDPLPRTCVARDDRRVAPALVRVGCGRLPSRHTTRTGSPAPMILGRRSGRTIQGCRRLKAVVRHWQNGASESEERSSESPQRPWAREPIRMCP